MRVKKLIKGKSTRDQSFFSGKLSFSILSMVIVKHKVFNGSTTASFCQRNIAIFLQQIHVKK